MSDRNKSIVGEVNAAFAENSVEGFLAHCADDIEWTMVGDRTVNGKEAVRQWMSSMDADPPTFTVDQVIAEGDFVTAYGDMTMKDKDGNATPYQYCDVYRFRGDEIAGLKSFVIRTGQS